MATQNIRSKEQLSQDTTRMENSSLTALVAQEAVIEKDVDSLNALLQAQGTDSVLHASRPPELLVQTKGSRLTDTDEQSEVNTPVSRTGTEQDPEFFTPRSSISIKRAPRSSTADSGLYIAYSPSAKKLSPSLGNRRGDRGEWRSLSRAISRKQPLEMSNSEAAFNTQLVGWEMDTMVAAAAPVAAQGLQANHTNSEQNSTSSRFATRSGLGGRGVKDASSPAVSPVSCDYSIDSMASEDSMPDMKHKNEGMPTISNQFALGIPMEPKTFGTVASTGAKMPPSIYHAATKSQSTSALVGSPAPNNNVRSWREDEQTLGTVTATEGTMPLPIHNAATKVPSTPALVDSPAPNHKSGPLPPWLEDEQGKVTVNTEHGTSARSNELDHIASTIRSHITATEETLQDHLRVRFEEAVDSMLAMLTLPGSNSSTITSSHLRLWAAEAVRPSEAAVRERFQVLQKRAMECLMLAKLPAQSGTQPSVSCGCAGQLCSLLPELVEGIKDPTLIDLCTAIRSKLPDSNESRATHLDVSRLEQLDVHVEQLESALNIAVVELEMGAADAKNLEASYISAQAKASSAEQRAAVAEKERDVLAQQLALLKQQAVMRPEPEVTVSCSDDSTTKAELRAHMAEASAEKAESVSSLLRQEVHILRLQAQMAIEQLRAFGIENTGEGTGSHPVRRQR